MKVCSVEKILKPAVRWTSVARPRKLEDTFWKRLVYTKYSNTRRRRRRRRRRR